MIYHVDVLYTYHISNESSYKEIKKLIVKSMPLPQFRFSVYWQLDCKSSRFLIQIVCRLMSPYFTFEEDQPGF
jgi:hypothetical protein